MFNLRWRPPIFFISIFLQFFLLVQRKETNETDDTTKRATRCFFSAKWLLSEKLGGSCSTSLSYDVSSLLYNDFFDWNSRFFFLERCRSLLYIPWLGIGWMKFNRENIINGMSINWLYINFLLIELFLVSKHCCNQRNYNNKWIFIIYLSVS